jgi:hypothetical protein
MAGLGKTSTLCRSVSLAPRTRASSTAAATAGSAGSEKSVAARTRPVFSRGHAAEEHPIEPGGPPTAHHHQRGLHRVGGTDDPSVGRPGLDVQPKPVDRPSGERHHPQLDRLGGLLLGLQQAGHLGAGALGEEGIVAQHVGHHVADDELAALEARALVPLADRLVGCLAQVGGDQDLGTQLHAATSTPGSRTPRRPCPGAGCEAVDGAPSLRSPSSRRAGNLDFALSFFGMGEL